MFFQIAANTFTEDSIPIAVNNGEGAHAVHQGALYLLVKQMQGFLENQAPDIQNQFRLRRTALEEYRHFLVHPLGQAELGRREGHAHGADGDHKTVPALFFQYLAFPLCTAAQHIHSNFQLLRLLGLEELDFILELLQLFLLLRQFLGETLKVGLHLFGLVFGHLAGSQLGNQILQLLALGLHESGQFGGLFPL